MKRDRKIAANSRQMAMPNAIYDIVGNSADTKHAEWFRLDRQDDGRYNVSMRMVSVSPRRWDRFLLRCWGRRAAAVPDVPVDYKQKYESLHRTIDETYRTFEGDYNGQNLSYESKFKKSNTSRHRCFGFRQITIRQKWKLSILVFIAILFSRCYVQNENNIDVNRIVGSWQLYKCQINYPELIFNVDSTAIFKSRADTVYRYSYSLKNDTLLLIDANKQINKIKIEKLNKEELVFKNLLEHKTKQKYYKNSSKTPNLR